MRSISRCSILPNRKKIQVQASAYQKTCLAELRLAELRLKADEAIANEPLQNALPQRKMRALPKQRNDAPMLYSSSISHFRARDPRCIWTFSPRSLNWDWTTNGKRW